MGLRELSSFSLCISNLDPGEVYGGRRAWVVLGPGQQHEGSRDAAPARTKLPLLLLQHARGAASLALWGQFSGQLYS